MKSKKNKKKYLIWLLSSISLGLALTTGIVAINNNNNINRINTPLISENNDYNFQLKNFNPIEKVNKFEGTVLTKADVQKLGWDSRTDILLEDWLIDAPNVTIIDNEAFENLGIESIEIPNQITSIGNNAFKDSTLMSSITIRPASQLTSIGNSAFDNSRITTLNLPNTVTSIGSNAFLDTTLLQGGQIEMLVTLKQKSTTPLYGFTQGQWNAITWREVPFQGQTLTKDDVIRIGWQNKSSITLDDWALDAPKVTRIDSFAFEGLNLSTIVVPNKVSDVRDNVFLNTDSLNSITMPYHLYVDAGPAIPSYGFTISQWDSIIWDDYPKVGKINKIIARELLRKSTIITWDAISQYEEIDNEAFKDTDISSIRIQRKKNFSVGDNAFENTPLLTTIQLSVMYKDAVHNFGLTEEQIAIIEYIDEVVPLTLPQKIAKNVIIVGGALVIVHITLWVLDWKSVKRRRMLLEAEQEALADEDSQEFINELYNAHNEEQYDMIDENYEDYDDENYDEWY
ncbi:MAG: leucine-rich repeat domain-containing protein [Metamycoplasmataceae bacterium]